MEIHELDLRYAGLHVADPGRAARLEASLARHGQESPVLVVKAAGSDKYVLVDGHLRVHALGDLGRDLVEVAVLPLDEASALVEVWRMEASRRRSALEDAWLLAELIERHGLSQAELARKLHRSKAWVSGRLGLVKALPEAAQAAVRQAVVPPQAAVKSLVPMARANAAHCTRLVEALGRTPVSVRQVARLYTTWRAADDDLRERIVSHPLLFLKADEAVASEHQADDGLKLAGDLEALAGMCGRVRRRVREGAFARANTASRKTAARSWRETRLAFDGLVELMDREVVRVGPGDPDGDPATAS